MSSLENKRTHNRSYLSLLCIKIKEEIDAVFFFAKYHSVNRTNIEKVAIQQTVFEQTAVVVKHKFIKCKQSVEGSIISPKMKLPYSNGESDVNEMEILVHVIQSAISLNFDYKFYRIKKKKRFDMKYFSSRKNISIYVAPVSI